MTGLGKKAFIASVCCAIASAGFVINVQAAEQKAADKVLQHNLEGIIVEGNADVMPGGFLSNKTKVGIFGDKNIMDVPYSEMIMTSKSLAVFDDPSQPLANVLQNNPSIRVSSSSPMYTDFSMRGINMNGNHMMLNGIPSLFYQFTTPPSHIIDRIDITSGPNAGVNGVSMSNNGTNGGSTAAPGTINIISKKAEATPVTRYTQTFSGRGNYGEYIDVGRRFGKDKEWGVRLNTEYMQGGLSLPGAEKNAKNIFVNIDHHNERSNTNLLAGYFDLRVNGGQRWFQFKPSADYKSQALPVVPDSKNNYDFDGTTKYVHGYLMTLNHEQKITDDWSWFANFGQSRRSGNKDNQGSAIKFDQDGNFVSNRFNQQNEAGKNVYAQLGIKGNFDTGELKHNVSFAVDRSWARYWNNAKSYSPGSSGITGNLYEGIIFPDDYKLQSFGAAKPEWEETNVGITLGDNLEYGKLQVLLAASRKHEDFNNLKGKVKHTNNNILPTYGISYKPVDNLAVYAGHTESFSRGLVVSGEYAGDKNNNKKYKYVNNGATLEPVKSKQNEVGIKYANAGILTTLSYFAIDEANRIDSVAGLSVDGDTLYKKVQDGKNSYKGLELTVNGKIAEKWNTTGGLLYLDAQREHTKNGLKDGMFVTGVSRWSSVVGLEYKPNDDWGIVGRAVWNDKAFVEDTNGKGKYEIPSHLTFDLGVNYKTQVHAMPVKFSAMCYNVTNRDYWMGRGGSSTFGLSMPRTFMLSAAFDI